MIYLCITSWHFKFIESNIRQHNVNANMTLIQDKVEILDKVELDINLILDSSM